MCNLLCFEIGSFLLSTVSLLLTKKKFFLIDGNKRNIGKFFLLGLFSYIEVRTVCCLSSLQLPESIILINILLVYNYIFSYNFKILFLKMQLN